MTTTTAPHDHDEGAIWRGLHPPTTCRVAKSPVTKPPRFRSTQSTPAGQGEVTVANLAEALESRRVQQLDRSAKITVRHGQSDRYVAAWTTENGRLVLLTSTVDMWRSPSERDELVERIIKQDRTIRDLRESLSDLEYEGEEGVGQLIAGLHARIEDLRLENEALRKRGAA